MLFAILVVVIFIILCHNRLVGLAIIAFLMFGPIETAKYLGFKQERPLKSALEKLQEQRPYVYHPYIPPDEQKKMRQEFQNRVRQQD